MNCDCNRGLVGGSVCEKCEGTMVIVEKPEAEVKKVAAKKKK